MPFEIESDRRIYPMLVELNACLCAELGDASPCFCGILMGADVPVEYAGQCEDENCGAAYVRVVNSYPSVDFPEPDVSASCNSVMAYSLAVGVLRCVSLGDDDGTPPSPEEMNELTLQMLSDMQAIRRAIQCCLGSNFEDLEYVLGAYTPLPMQGGVAGGETLLTVREVF